MDTMDAVCITLSSVLHNGGVMDRSRSKESKNQVSIHDLNVGSESVDEFELLKLVSEHYLIQQVRVK